MAPGSPRILVVSPPALDLVDGRSRPGGPGVYAGGALSLMGARVEAVGPYGYCTSQVVRAEASLGVHRVGYQVPGPGYVNKLVYSREGRRVHPVSRTPAIDPSILAGLASSYWDAVILSPLWGEDPGSLPGVLSDRTRLLVVDVQGYARGGVEPWLLARTIQVLHAGDGEPWDPRGASIVLATSGPGPVRVYWRGSLVAKLTPRPWGGRDPTGAGDVFTGLFVYWLIRGETITGAVEYALESVGEVLDYIVSVLDEHSVNVAYGHCG